MAAAPTTFAQLCQLNYKAQAIWYLNGFWASAELFAEQIWEWHAHFVALDNRQTPPKGAAGNELDQFWSAKFIEDKDEALTAIQRKEALKTIDVDSNGKMSLIEYVIWKYGNDPNEVVRASQGSDSRKIQQAQQKMDQVSKAIEEITPKLEAAKKAAAEVRAAEAELQAAVDDLRAQEEAYHGRIAELEKTSNDQSIGVVKRNKAANELQQLKAEDPLPLRRAKITQEAALKKVTKQREKADAAEAQLQAAYDDLGVKMEEARAELQAAKASGAGLGGVWWLERELFEADKSLPKSKQKYDHTRAFQFSS